MVLASWLYSISAYERFPRDAQVLDSGGKPEFGHSLVTCYQQVLRHDFNVGAIPIELGFSSSEKDFGIQLRVFLENENVLAETKIR